MDKKEIYQTCWNLLRLNQEKEVIELLKQHPFLLNEHFTSFRSTIFQLSCVYGLHEVVDYLVKQGVDINQTDDIGETALFYVMDARDEIMIEKLLQLDIDLNPYNENGYPILIYSAFLNFEKGLEKLIRHGADVNIEDEKKHSILDYVSNEECIIPIEFFMQYFDKFNEKNQKKLKKIRLKRLVERGITHE